MKLLSLSLSEKRITYLEVALIVITAFIPLLLEHPYRINLFLAWEGAFRMSEGEIPYRDFGSPVGYGFWVLPAIFFRIFGPYVFTLLIFQAFVNVGSGLLFRGILNIFNVAPGVRFLSILVYCLSYSMFNFWPWYNHLVVIFELLGLYLLVREIIKAPDQRRHWLLVVSAFIIAFSFMTKQDTGALGFFIALVLLAFDYVYERSFKSAIWFVLGYLASMALLIGPFLQYEFSYWFNMGQFPHNARVDKFDIVNEFLGASQLIKLYLLLLVAILFIRFRENSDWKSQKLFVFFTLVTLAILGQAAIIQVTSYTPVDGNIYFHSFAFAFIGSFFLARVNLQRVAPLAIFTVLICLWWSGVFWTRFLRQRVEALLVSDKAARENVISKRTYLISSDTLTSNRSKWIVPYNAPSFKRIRIPENTVEGISRIMELPEMKNPNVNLLNMTELTPLAHDLNLKRETGPDYPLWFHKGVSFFDREVEVFCDKVANREYDVILFEDIPNVNQFYPYEVRDCIRENYVFKFKFLAPRIPEISYIEVYTKE